MPFYKKRPVVVDAVEWEGGAEKASQVIDWALYFGGTIRYREGEFAYVGLHFDGKQMTTEEWVPEHLSIDTLEGTMKASAGDFIIRGVKGEFYPCKPDIFHETYERI